MTMFLTLSLLNTRRNKIGLKKLVNILFFLEEVLNSNLGLLIMLSSLKRSAHFCFVAVSPALCCGKTDLC